MNTGNFSQILSSAITPVTLLTGVAFITSIMAPRFGRCIDRIRVILRLHNELQTETLQPLQYEAYSKQLKILYRRTKLLRNSMVSAGLCILCIALTVGLNFLCLISGMQNTFAPMAFFIMALVCLVFLALGFTFDFIISLKAVKLEIETEWPIGK